MGIHPTYFSLATSPGSQLHKPELTQLMDEVQQQIHDKTVDLSTVIKTVSREALKTQVELMRSTNNEAIKLKATQDFLDRNPETSKVQKHQVESFSISSEDARALAEAMVRSAALRQMPHSQEASVGDFVRIPMEDLNADQGIVPEVRQLNPPNLLGASGQSRELARPEVHLSAGEPAQGPVARDHEAEGEASGLIAWEDDQRASA